MKKKVRKVCGGLASCEVSISKFLIWRLEILRNRNYGRRRASYFIIGGDVRRIVCRRFAAFGRTVFGGKKNFYDLLFL